jgi:hypothetical protein
MTEKAVLRRATPVARERAPTGVNPHPAGSTPKGLAQRPGQEMLDK